MRDQIGEGVMKKFTTILSAAALVAFTAPAGMAASVLIDDFSTEQRVETDPINFPVSSTVSTGILGADRTMTVLEVDQTGPVTQPGTFLLSSGMPSNFLDFTNGNGRASIATLRYDFASAVDLTDSGTNNAFLFQDIFGDIAGTELTTTVFNGLVDFSFTEVLPAITDPGFSPLTFFSLFGGADFENVTSLVFEFDATNSASFDGTLGSISAVPLPASALLLLGGLGGFAGLSAANRRRRRKEA